MDKYELNLELKIKQLKECQDNQNKASLGEFKTCSSCDEYFKCQLRKDYVTAVYQSMNKGSTGGFEF